MTDPADLARENAIPLEIKKDGLQQRQNGDWVLRVVIQAADMDDRLTKAPMGTRFMAALVEVGTDELPVTASTKLAPDADNTRRQWRDMQPAQQAGIRCAEPVFAAFLKEQYPEDWRALEGNAAELVRYICGVNSRAQISTSPAARAIWHQLDEQFQAWKAKENA